MKKLSKTKRFSGILIDVYESIFEHKGNPLRIEQVEHCGGVCVAATNDEGMLLLVKQFRFGIEQDLLEFPAGLIDKNESPEACAIRELQEETGYKAKSLIDLGKIYLSPGYSNELTHLFYAKDLSYVGTNFDDTEDITQVEIPLDTLIQMCDEHRIEDVKTLALAYKLRQLQSKSEL